MNFVLTEKISKVDFFVFAWHGIFLSLASNFMDVHTIIPSMLIKAGGNSIMLGFLTAIIVGGAGNILPMIFPLIAGILISVWGYTTTFIILSLIVSSSFVFIDKLDCRKVAFER